MCTGLWDQQDTNFLHPAIYCRPRGAWTHDLLIMSQTLLTYWAIGLKRVLIIFVRPLGYGPRISAVKGRRVSQLLYRRKIKIWESTCQSSRVAISFLISTLASYRIMPRHHFNLNWVRRCIFISVAPTKNLSFYYRFSIFSYNSPHHRVSINTLE